TPLTRWNLTDSKKNVDSKNWLRSNVVKRKLSALRKNRSVQYVAVKQQSRYPKPNPRKHKSFIGWNCVDAIEAIFVPVLTRKQIFGGSSTRSNVMRPATLPEIMLKTPHRHWRHITLPRALAKKLMMVSNT